MFLYYILFIRDSGGVAQQISKIQVSSGLSLIRAGFSASSGLAALTLPSAGAKMSAVVFTLSMTAPEWPLLIFLFTDGTST